MNNIVEPLVPSFVDASGVAPLRPNIPGALLVSKESIDAEIERLAEIPRPANGRRASRIVHPQARSAHGFAPGTAVTINVLKPGESSTPSRINANQIEICIRGAGSVVTKGVFNTVVRDLWTIPPMQVYAHHNTGTDLWVRLTYSNAPVLDMLGVLYEEEGDQIGSAETESEAVSSEQKQTYVAQAAPDYAIGSAGARLRGYEFLTDIPVVESLPLHWQWSEMEKYLSHAVGDGRRMIMLMYNPATERRAGTSNSFFATYGGCPPGTPPFVNRTGHRHTSSAVNYHLRGYGKSIVDGQTVEWKAGDLLMSAPGWSEHAHYPGPEGWRVMTVQDHPMHIALGSLLWQEKLNGPILALGAETGQTGYTGPRRPGD